MSGRPARFSQAEIARVLRAVKQEEAIVEVELRQDGNILIRPSEIQSVRRVASNIRPKL